MSARVPEEMREARARLRRSREALQRRLFANWCAVQKFPAPVAEFAFAPPRKWRFDFAFAAERIAVEIEGGIFPRKGGLRGAHGSVTGILRDIEKYNAAAVRGWCVLRVRPAALLTHATAVLIAAALRTRAAA